MNIGICGSGNADRSFLRALIGMFGGEIQFIPSVFAPTFKKQKNRKSGSRMNQRQLRKRAAQGCAVRQESRLKQRRA